jgi:hypothetical protein
MLRLGRVRASPVVAGEYAIGALAAVILSKSAATVVGVVVLVLLPLYCFARPHGGWSVWGAAVAPAAVGSIVSTFGPPKWVGLFVIPIMLLMVWALDQDPPEARTVVSQSDPAQGRLG